MFISDINRKHFLRAVIATLLSSLFCIVFTYVYYRHSHKVYSDWMTYMFLIPLVGGTVIYLFFTLISKYVHRSRTAFNLYNSGIATLTLGCCCMGVFEISGGDSLYVFVFFLVGALLCIIGIIAFIAAQIRKSQIESE